MKEEGNKPKVLDLFSGCGGFSLGFIKAGYEVILGVDNDEIALKTFDYNHNNADALKIDLSEKMAMDTLKEKVGNNKIDVIIRYFPKVTSLLISSNPCSTPLIK